MFNLIPPHERKKTFVLELHSLEPKWRPRCVRPLIGKAKGVWPDP